MTDDPELHPAGHARHPGQELTWLEQQAGHIQIAAEHELRQAGSSGMNELELIRALQAERWQLIGPVRLSDPVALYPVHFLLFHALYRLQAELAAHGEWLEVSPLQLKIICSGTSSRATPVTDDPLRSFYLDLSGYYLSDETIRDTMARFFVRLPLRQSHPAEIKEAAHQLGFGTPPEHFEPIKRQFRRQVMQVHPDRGGRTEDIQELNRAFSILKRHYARYNNRPSIT
ncbi:MAG TPA: DNA-J related domain-containing protein [Marinobacter sp.]|nr:DNA-J related domain-containing protein [Marinobacter sp.]